MVRPRPRVVACLGCSCRPLSRSHSRFAWRTAGASYTSHPPPPPRPAGTRLAALRRRSPSICSAAAAHHSLSLPPPPSPRRACLAATAAALGSKPCGWAGAPSGSRPPTRSLNAAERTREAAPACHPDRRRRWRFRWKFRHERVSSRPLVAYSRQHLPRRHACATRRTRATYQGARSAECKMRRFCPPFQSALYIDIFPGL